MNPHDLHLPTEFNSDRLLLRRYRPGDAALYARMLKENQEHLYEYLPHELVVVQNEQDAAAEFVRQVREWHARRLFIFGAWEKASGEHVGEIYLANADWEVPRLELGYFIVRAHTGRGFAGEAAGTAVRYAFEHMQLIRLDLQCVIDNLASQRVAERCGFKREGCFRQYHRKKDGSLVDTLWYGLLRSEWRP